MTVAALVFLAAYAWPILSPDLGGAWVSACRWATWGTWLLFAVCYLVRLMLSADRKQFVRSNLLDLAVIALPLLRPLRLLRLVTILTSLDRRAGTSLRGRVGIYVAGSAVLVVFISSLAVLDAERGGSGPIQNFESALWWAMTTITTVGYGDTFPVTSTGRAVAAGLMVSGVAILGIVTASLASWLVERVAEAEDAGHDATRAELNLLADEVRELTALIAAQNGPVAEPPPEGEAASPAH